jgi:hypothetical protein
MTWLRKSQTLIVALVVFAVLALPGSDWIDGFLGGFS